MYIYVRPAGAKTEKMITVGTYSSLIELVKQFESVDVVVKPSEGEKVPSVVKAMLERRIKDHCGRDCNEFMEPVMVRFPFLEVENSLFKGADYGEVTAR